MNTMPSFRFRAAGLRAWTVGVALLVLVGAAVSPAVAGKVQLKIRTGNPIEKPQKVKIHSLLPPRLNTNDIISLDGLDLGYDVKSGCYYVDKEIELGPKEIRVFTIELKDVWSLPAPEIATIRKRTEELVEKLKGNPDYGKAAQLKEEIEKSLALVENSQAETALKPGEKINPHIKTYESNLNTLKRIREAVGRIENYVLGAGLDPGGELIGDVKGLSLPKHEVDLPPEAYKTAIIRITVRNQSPTEARTNLMVRRDLPAEIKLNDILDTGGLDASTDPKTGLCYVFKSDVGVPPGKTVSFDVTIRDKWNINAPRIAGVRTSATNLLVLIAAKAKFTSVEDMLRGLVAELDQLEKEAGPEALNDRYVAFYRDQSVRLDVIEQKVLRVEAALRPKPEGQKLGFDAKPPSMKTTWMIIYIILGFLVVMSLLFFFRWFGKSGSEKMDDKAGGAA